MTSRQKRFQREQAEEVQMALTGHTRCPQCKKFFREPGEGDLFQFDMSGLCPKCWLGMISAPIFNLSGLPLGTTFRKFSGGLTLDGIDDSVVLEFK